MQVMSSMSRNVYTISPEASINEGFDLMGDAQIRHLPVVDADEQLVGILSERDLLLRAQYEPSTGEIQFPDLRVGEVMVTHIISCTPKTSLAEVATLFVKEKIDCMPVLGSRNKLIGLITTTDILSVMSEIDSDEKMTPLPFTFNLNHRSGQARTSRPRPWS